MFHKGVCYRYHGGKFDLIFFLTNVKYIEINYKVFCYFLEYILKKELMIGDSGFTKKKKHFYSDLHRYLKFHTYFTVINDI